MPIRLSALCVFVLLCAACDGGEVLATRLDAGGADAAEGKADTLGDGGWTSWDLASCVGLACRQASCPVGQETKLTGTVRTPRGDLPLYNVSVFVPNAPLPPFQVGVSCESCAAYSAAKPVVSALTGADGSFTLTNVPTGADVPVVMQVGKWRKQITIPNVTACTTAPIDPAQLAMPRNKSEGDIPRIAIATGYADPFECLLPKIGLDPAEVTAPSGTGRVHYYRTRHVDSTGTVADGRDLAGGAPDASLLFDNLNQLRLYDVVLLPCEGHEWGGKSATAAANMRDYADLGGRLFTTHYSYTWIYGTSAATLPWSTTGTWNVDQKFDEVAASQLIGKLDTSFPKGMAFAQWLTNVGASSTPGQLVINQWRHDLDQAMPPAATRWIYGATPTFRYRNNTICSSDSGCAAANRPCVRNRCTTEVPASPTDNSVQHITFNTPLGQPTANQCGRIVYSDFHVSAAALKASEDPTNLGSFPSMCRSDALSAQEKALIFMLFDLSACVQDDTKPPEPPVPVL